MGVQSSFGEDLKGSFREEKKRKGASRLANVLKKKPSS